MFSHRTTTSRAGIAARPRHASAWFAPLAVLLAAVAVAAPALRADAAQTPVGLGTAGSFAILAGSRDHQHRTPPPSTGTSAHSRPRPKPAWHR